MEQRNPNPSDSSTAARESAEDFNRLLEQVYNELRKIAHFHRLNERQNLTLQTTALVHEAYMRLAKSNAVPKPNDERHLKALTSRIIRQVLVDHARKHNAQKRDAGAAQNDPRSSDGTDPAVDVGILDLDQALKHLAERSGRLAEVVEHRYFGGMTNLETAEAMGVSERTIERDWIRAKAYLLDFLEDPDRPE